MFSRNFFFLNFNLWLFINCPSPKKLLYEKVTKWWGYETETVVKLLHYIIVEPVNFKKSGQKKLGKFLLWIFSIINSNLTLQKIIPIFHQIVVSIPFPWNQFHDFHKNDFTENLTNFFEIFWLTVYIPVINLASLLHKNVPAAATSAISPILLNMWNFEAMSSHLSRRPSRQLIYNKHLKLY